MATTQCMKVGSILSGGLGGFGGFGGSGESGGLASSAHLDAVGGCCAHMHPYRNFNSQRRMAVRRTQPCDENNPVELAFYHSFTRNKNRCQLLFIMLPVHHQESIEFELVIDISNKRRTRIRRPTVVHVSEGLRLGRHAQY